MQGVGGVDRALSARAAQLLWSSACKRSLSPAPRCGDSLGFAGRQIVCNESPNSLIGAVASSVRSHAVSGVSPRGGLCLRSYQLRGGEWLGGEAWHVARR